MSAFVPQQPNVPPVGPYFNSATPRLFGITADDIRRVKKEAAEEDYSQFLTSDTQYMNYKKTNQEIIYFENLQRSNPNFMRLTLPTTSYPLRCDSAYFMFQFDCYITLLKRTKESPPKPDKKPEEKKDDKDPVVEDKKDPVVEDKKDKPKDEGEKPSSPPVYMNGTHGTHRADDDQLPPMKLSDICPTSFKFFKLLESYEISVGSNGCVITNAEQSYHYQNRVMSLISKPISKSNMCQEYAAADIFPYMLPFDGNSFSDFKEFRDQFWAIYKINPDTVVQKDDRDVVVRIPLQFQIPLTLLHPLYNVNGVIPPGMPTVFSFQFRNLNNIGKYLFRPDSKFKSQMTIKSRIAATLSYLYIEQPRRYPSILRSLKEKAYYNDFLMEGFQRMDFRVGRGVDRIDKLALLQPGGNVPVRIDYILMQTSMLKNSFKFWNDARTAVKSIKFLIHFPFPYEKETVYTDMEAKENPRTNILYHPDVAQPWFHSADNFQYASFGNQHIAHGCFPQINFMEPAVQWGMQRDLEEGADHTKSMDFALKVGETLPSAVLLLPSDQLNQNPYPRIRGDVYATINFKDKMEEDTQYTLFANYYYWYRIHQENGKCSILPIDDLGAKLDQADRN